MGVAVSLHLIICLSGKNGFLPASGAQGGDVFDSASVVFYFLIIICAPPFEKNTG